MQTITRINSIQNVFGYDILEEIKDVIEDCSMMADYERAFLNALIRKNKPQKILELGVAKGGSSILILNAIKDIENSHLYSIDYLENLYCDKSKKTGYVVEERIPQLSPKWTLYTGGLACKFIDKIGTDIDFCLIDTVHRNPGEILDFLMILPYLKDGAIVVFHDIALHFITKVDIIGWTKTYQKTNTNGLLMSAIKGTKILPEYVTTPYPNIGAIVIDKSTREQIWDVFNLLTQNWTYTIPEEEVSFIQKHFERFYNNSLIEIYKTAIQIYNKETDKNLSQTMYSADLKSNIKEAQTKATKYFWLYKTALGKKRKEKKRLYKYYKERVRILSKYLADIKEH